MAHDEGMATPPRSMPGSTIIAATAAVAVVAIAAIALLGTADMVVYDVESPEAAAQDYLQALFDGDLDRAYEFLSPDQQARCEPYELRISGDRFTSASFVGTATTGDRAIIDVRLSGLDVIPDPALFGTTELDTEVVLESVDGAWRIVAADWPLDRCLWR